MTNEIKHYLSFYKNLVPSFTAEELDYITSFLKLIHLKKGAFYLKQGHIQKEIGFVSKGLVRQYYIDSKGNDITTRFNAENSFSTDYHAFIHQNPSNYNIQCLEDTTIIQLGHQDMQTCYSNYKNYERFGRLIAETILSERQKQIESLLFENAEKRYAHFLAQNAHLFNRISVSHLSTYLGIKRQSLSRIRNKMAK
jgi:CRP-like cAMP-binding protein